MPFKICNIGCGNLATEVHGPSYRKYADLHPEVELAACCDLDAEKAATFQNRFGFSRSYTDCMLMLERERPDAVCLMAPVTLTARLSCEIMAQGYPLLMEKPPGLNRDECRQMIAVAEKHGVPNQVAFNRRYTPLIRELKSRLEAEFSPQDIHHLKLDFYRINRCDADFATTAIHGIDTVRFLAGSDYRRVRFRYQEFPELGPAVANIFMVCEFASGATAQISFCPVCGVQVERLTIHALNHTFFLNVPMWQAFDAPGRLQHLENGQLQCDLSGDALPDAHQLFECSGFYDENRAFFDDLQAGRHPVGDIRSGLQSVEIADCIRQRRPEYYI